MIIIISSHHHLRTRVYPCLLLYSINIFEKIKPTFRMMLKSLLVHCSTSESHVKGWRNVKVRTNGLPAGITPRFPWATMQGFADDARTRRIRFVALSVYTQSRPRFYLNLQPAIWFKTAFCTSGLKNEKLKEEEEKKALLRSKLVVTEKRCGAVQQQVTLKVEKRPSPNSRSSETSVVRINGLEVILT